MDTFKCLNGVDVSSFLLVEESADSDADFLTCMEMYRATAAGREDDDAESCIGEYTSETHHLKDGGDDQVFDCDDVDDQDFFSDCDDDDDDDVELSWSTTCKLWLGYMSTEEGEEEESSRVGFKTKVKDDMEDRVFWETCMAVGYP
ncbi:hypothetical protein ACOSP7_007424 [Xanthoceras sorbifolium]